MIVIEKWQGVVTNASPYSVPGGAFVLQTNLQCIKPGQVQGRLGLQAVAAVDGNDPVIAAVRLTGGTERVVLQAGSELHVEAIT